MKALKEIKFEEITTYYQLLKIIMLLESNSNSKISLIIENMHFKPEEMKETSYLISVLMKSRTG
jgi:hypothetical protein